MALRNLESILNAFDGVMVARGDMGVELAQEEVPVWQKTIIPPSSAEGQSIYRSHPDVGVDDQRAKAHPSRSL